MQSQQGEFYSYSTPSFSFDDYSTPRHNSLPSSSVSLSQPYYTNINELISEPAQQSMSTTATNFLIHLYQLSTYLFRKRNQIIAENKGEQQFTEYLTMMEESLGEMNKFKKSKGIEEIVLEEEENAFIDSQLIKCLQKLPYIYSEERFFPDFSHFSISLTNSRHRYDISHLHSEQESLNDTLDMVEINLFAQIHKKFHQYFKIVANFDYLRESISIQLNKLKQSRKSIRSVKKQFVDKSAKLRQRIIQRQNIQKVLKNIKIVRSVKKLPVIIESILKSSFPYECLQLLQSTKQSLQHVQSLACLASTTLTLKQCETLVQIDLNKRYNNQLYMYLEECHAKDKVKLDEIWRRIETNNGQILDKDSSILAQNLDSSSLSASGLDRSGFNILQEIQNIESGHSNATLARNHFVKRDQAKQYEIAMILLQSYEYVTFTSEIIKIMICNALRLFAKRFQKQLGIYLRQIIKQEIKGREEKILDQISEETPKQDQVAANLKQTPQPVLTLKEGDEEQALSPDLISKISVDFYIKHIALLNDIFKETINRFLGYMLTLISEYEEELSKEMIQLAAKQGSSKSIIDNEEKIRVKHNKFKQIFIEQFTLLPSLFKIVQQKIKNLLYLKNISNINSLQFYRWLSMFKFWQKYFDFLVDEHPLINFSYPNLKSSENLNQSSSLKDSQRYTEMGHKMIEELVDIVHDGVRKGISTMNLDGQFIELITQYVTGVHKTNLQNEIIPAITNQNWQSSQIPPQFSDILSSILNCQEGATNISISILNSSKQSISSRDVSMQEGKKDTKQGQIQVIPQLQQGPKMKFKIFKNFITANNERYKINISFMSLCEYIDQNGKLSRLLSPILNKRNSAGLVPNSVTALILDKTYELIEKYCSMTNELILQAKLVKMASWKNKNINAKHICLLCNCLTLLQKIMLAMVDEKVILANNMIERRKAVSDTIQSNIKALISKLANIIQGKVEQLIKPHLQANSDSTTTVTQTNINIVNNFLGMVSVTDEYFSVELVKKVISGAFKVIVQKYITWLMLRGERGKSDLQGFVDNLKFIRKYFPQEFDNLIHEISS